MGQASAPVAPRQPRKLLKLPKLVRSGVRSGAQSARNGVRSGAQGARSGVRSGVETRPQLRPRQLPPNKTLLIKDRS
jgi:hypothetical protein